MGRRPTRPGSIPRFRSRKQKSGVVFYYYDHGGKPRRETPLGSDYGLAIKKWAELEHADAAPVVASVLTFAYVAQQYKLKVIPTKAERTQQDNKRELENLLEFFNDPPAPLDAIHPMNVRQYMTWRTAEGTGFVRANREKALLSHIWNFARDQGYTALANPCAGIKGFNEEGRDAYIEDVEMKRVRAAGDQCLRDGIDLAYLTGQRPADVLRMSEMDVRDGAVHLRQGKTRKRLRIAVVGELAELLQRIRARKAVISERTRVHNTRLIVNENGRAIGVNAMSRRWAKACAEAGITGIQFRDLRAKAGTDKADDAGDIRQAQQQLGHASVVMTEVYVRNRKGQKTTPTR
jgi:integrase